MLNKRLTKKLRRLKINVSDLDLSNRVHIGVNEFKAVNWLPTKERFEQCTAAKVFKFLIMQPHHLCLRCSYQLVRAESFEDLKKN